MKNGLFKKSWAVGLMVLFIVGGLTSNIGADDIRPTNTRGVVYVDDDAICPGHGTLAAPYCRIRYAIENTSGGDVIMVASGTYNENIVIDKKGFIRYKHVGPVTDDILKKKILPLIEKLKAA